MGLVVEESYGRHRILAIDPGSMSTGFAIYHMNNEIIEAIDAFTVKPAKSLLKIGREEEDSSERNTRLLLLRKIYMRMLNEIQPTLVISESPFYNPRMPGAYGVLVEVVSIFRLATYDYKPEVNFFTIEPVLVKKGVGAKTIAGKIDMRTSLRIHMEISTKLIVPLDDIDEHGVDAVAVGYSWLNSTLELTK